MFRIDHDFHCHTSLSSCCHDEQMTPEAIGLHAKKDGYNSVCITDHLWDSDIPGASEWYSKQDINHVCSLLPLPDIDGIQFYFGCETEYCGGNILALSPNHFNLFDFIVIPVNHMHFEGLVRPKGIETAKEIANLVINRLEELLNLSIDFRKIGIAHLNCGLMFQGGEVNSVLRLMDKKRLAEVFKEYALRGSGIELNDCYFANWQKDKVSSLRIFEIAASSGCKFYCGTDAHKTQQMQIRYLPDVVKALELNFSNQYKIP